MELVKQGKVKDVYRFDKDNYVFKFSDRVSAFDIKFKEDIPNKGDILSKFSTFWFEKLGIPHHYVRRLDENAIIVKRLDMIPLECIVRGYYFGSLMKRVENGSEILPNGFPTEKGHKFPYPIFDPTTKSDIEDLPIERDQILEQKILNELEYDWIKSTSINIYNRMYEILDEKGFILVDIKLEFGKVNGQIVLGDSVGPDEYRIWKKDDYQQGKYTSLDKQILRDWLTNQVEDINNISGFSKGHYLNIQLSDEIRNRLSDVYKKSYELISS